jgi:hypothetical protein
MFVSGKFHFIVWRLIFTSEHFRFSNLTYQFCLRRTENEIEIYQLLKTWFNPNCPWFCKAIIFCVARKSKILHTTRHGLTLEIETKTVFFSKETYILLEPIQSMKNKVSNIGPNEPSASTHFHFCFCQKQDVKHSNKMWITVIRCESQ